jgi:hypothetical protein
MPNASEEQTWWSNLFTGGADPGLDVPDGLWESVVTTAFEIDVPEPADDVMPADQLEMGSDELDEEAGINHEVGHPSADGDANVADVLGGTGPELDAGPIAEDTYNDCFGHEAVYDVATDDSVVDGPDAIDDELY